ncbi:MAG: replication initiator protein WhiP [Desulfurococcales archaeon]|nr:replication initiator protein WhiP [Desulfurococcales archaeon]
MDDSWRIAERIIARARRGQARGGPRSRLVDAIMVLLLSRPMRSSEIGELLGLESKYVSSYLSYWRARGYVEYESGLWQLTPLGEDYAREVISRETSSEYDKFVSLARRIAEPVNRTRNDKRRAPRRGKESGSLSFTVSNKGVGDKKRQEREEAAACVLSALRNLLSEEELDLMRLILDHYVEWGSTYTYVDQMAESIKADLTWLMKVLRGLQSKGLIYIYTDPRLGVRVGLSRRVKEELKPC